MTTSNRTNGSALSADLYAVYCHRASSILTFAWRLLTLLLVLPLRPWLLLLLLLLLLVLLLLLLLLLLLVMRGVLVVAVDVFGLCRGQQILFHSLLPRGSAHLACCLALHQSKLKPV